MMKLPKLDWFLAGNRFSGSYRSDPTRGCLCQSTFTYNAQAIAHGEDASLVAACYFQLPFGEVTNMDEAWVGRFELSPFGIEVCEGWIWSKCFGESAPAALPSPENGTPALVSYE